LLDKLAKRLDCRLCCVHLLDSFYCCEPATFISATLLVAATMMRMALPHVNVLTKIDLLPLYGPLPFKLNFFTEMVDLMPLVRYLDEPFGVQREELDREVVDEEEDEEEAQDAHKAKEGGHELKAKVRKMNEALCDLVTDFGLISFLPMNVQDAATVGRVLAAVDRANGYSFAASEAQAMRCGGGDEGSLNHLFNLASRDLEHTYETSLDILERYEEDLASRK